MKPNSTEFNDGETEELKYQYSPDRPQHSHYWVYAINQDLWVCSCGAHKDRFTGEPLEVVK